MKQYSGSVIVHSALVFRSLWLHCGWYTEGLDSGTLIPTYSSCHIVNKEDPG
jgi:hypothetical protein